MTYIYAEIDENNICCGLSELSGEVIKDTMIPLETYDTSLLGMKYVDGAWEEIPQELTPEPELTEVELIQAEILLNQAEILARQNEQDEVLAAILLNQMEV